MKETLHNPSALRKATSGLMLGAVLVTHIFTGCGSTEKKQDDQRELEVQQEDRELPGCAVYAQPLGNRRVGIGVELLNNTGDQAFTATTAHINYGDGTREENVRLGKQHQYAQTGDFIVKATIVLQIGEGSTMALQTGDLMTCTDDIAHAVE